MSTGRRRQGEGVELSDERAEEYFRLVRSFSSSFLPFDQHGMGRSERLHRKSRNRKSSESTFLLGNKRSVVCDSRYHPSTRSCPFRSEMRRAGGGCTERSQAVSQLATTTLLDRKKVRETVGRALLYAVLTRPQDGRQPPSSPLARSVRRARWLGRRTLWMRKTSRR
jgi:hypothetical protein